MILHHRILRLLATTLVTTVASAAGAGPWSRLPEAVSRLQLQRDDTEAQMVLAEAEQSVLGEAAAGHLAAVSALMDAYASLVAPLAEGDRRIEALQRRTARLLLEVGQSHAGDDVLFAGTAWGLAAQYDGGDAVVDLLRGLLVPPSDPEPGQVWQAAADGATLVWHPPLRFLMGCTKGDGDCRQDEKYLRWVEIPGLWIDRTEVTNRMYRRCVEVNSCLPPAESAAFEVEQREDEPVTGVDWNQARAYARWAGRRLPSESEWERCARGRRTDWRYPWGTSRTRIRANVLGKSGATDTFLAPAPVASFYRTGWGIHDIAGNVWEWCEDSFFVNLIQAPRDGTPWTEKGQGKVLRGGSWRRTMEMARVSSRIWHEPWYAADDVGFRCAADTAQAIDPMVVVASAARVFPIQTQPGRELEAAALSAADRRYLERRSVTWLMLEGRAWEALSQAMVLLQREPSDPVAGGLLDRLEDELVSAADQGTVEELKWRLEQYRGAVAGIGRLGDRLVATENRVMAALLRSGDRDRQRGDAAGAAARYRVALSISPGEEQLLDRLRATLPEAGAPRVWTEDDREMVWIPAGKFLMGRGRGDENAGFDEQPAHTVWVEGFWIDRTEVTNEEYRRCVDAGGCTPPHSTTAYDDPQLSGHPVVWVDWFQARDYAVWAGKRLPTETEWERASRAGQPTRYPWGDRWVEGRANAFGIREGDFWSGSSPVGSFPASSWATFDMIGNAWEWVEDVYHSDYRGAPRDGRAWLQVTGGAARPERVLRGGSFANFPPKLRTSQRDHRPPESSAKNTGFRCAADAEER